MLGKKRSSSMFVPEDWEVPSLQGVAVYKETDSAETVRKESPPAAVSVPMKNRSCVQDEGDEAQRTLCNQGGATLRAHSLFFAPENDSRDFSSVLSDVQEYVTSKYSTLITENGRDAKEQIKRYIAKYVQDHRIAVKGLTGDKLIDALYTEMAEFGFLTKYIFGSGIEEINSATRS